LGAEADVLAVGGFKVSELPGQAGGEGLKGLILIVTAAEGI
jgi:hypothetical protein